MNILIIDDNKYITDSISIFAESKGYFCKISNDGKKVCNLAHRKF